MPILEARGLTRAFAAGPSRVEVLSGVDLDLDEGQGIAVTGPSGSGKSTLLHVLGALDRPDAGTLRVLGEDPYALDDDGLARFRNRVVGFVFQDHHLLAQLTLEENVLLPALALPASHAEVGAARRRARELLGMAGLGERLGHRPAEVSGGERQRAAVARALLLEPRLLLCDEPTGSLDADAAAQVADLLLAAGAAAGRALVVVTHSPELARRLPRRLELRQGKLHPGSPPASTRP